MGLEPARSGIQLRLLRSTASGGVLGEVTSFGFVEGDRGKAKGFARVHLYLPVGRGQRPTSRGARNIEYARLTLTCLEIARLAVVAHPVLEAVSKPSGRCPFP